MAQRNVARTLKQLSSELRYCSSEGNLKNSLLMKYILQQYKKYKVTDQQLCKAQQEMKYLSESYLCYLQSLRKYKELNEQYQAKGERSIEETANLVGFNLPHDPVKRTYLQCPPKYFKLKGMKNCHSWLSCSDISKMKIHELLALGTVKDVYLASWKDQFVTLSKLKDVKFVDDFQHGLNMLKLLNPSRYIVQFVGYCEKKRIIITEYHPNGNAVNITSLAKNSVVKRLQLCLNYAEILNFLHNGPGGTRVFCDSNDLVKLLSQLLVTEELMLVLNDLDALPEVTPNNRILCGHKELKGSFVAPEQLWNHDGLFNEMLMIGYDEKTDIWKAPAVCNHFMKNINGNEVALYRLFNTHKQCRSQDPTKRPTAEDLVTVYNRVIEELNDHEEL